MKHQRPYKQTPYNPNAEIAQLERQLKALYALREEMIATYGEDNPGMNDIDMKIDQTIKKIARHKIEIIQG